MDLFSSFPLIYFIPFIAFLILYIIYYYKFRKYIYHQAASDSILNRNTAYLPPFPFGWFRLCDSDDLQKNQRKYIDCLGENLVLFRFEDNLPYALDSDRVKTGKPQRKWLVQENMHQIWIWYHPQEEHRLKPIFHLIDENIYNHVQYRGYSRNIINNHLAEVLENTADYIHFNYVHTSFRGIDCLKYFYEMKWKTAEDPELKNYLAHDDPFQNENRKNLLSKLISDKNRPYMSVNGLEAYVTMPSLGIKKHFLTGTAFHLGPNIIYYNFNSRFFDVLFIMTAIPMERYKQHFTVTVFTNKNMPYFISAPLIYGEMSQMTNDGEIWDNKKNPTRLYYNQHGIYDKMFIDWRNFYARFFKGCEKKEEIAE